MKSVETPIQLRFVDIDQFGHVNNAVYLSYLEVARIPYFDKIIGKIDWLNEGIILANAEINYKLPILLQDIISVHVWCSKLGTKSFDLSYRIIKKTDSGETEMATAKTVMVCYNYSKSSTIPVPADWVTKLM